MSLLRSYNLVIVWLNSPCTSQDKKQPSALLGLSRVCFRVLCPQFFSQMRREPNNVFCFLGGFFYNGVYLEQYVKCLPPVGLFALMPRASFHLEAAAEGGVNIHTASAFCSTYYLFLPLICFALSFSVRESVLFSVII